MKKLESSKNMRRLMKMNKYQKQIHQKVKRFDQMFMWHNYRQIRKVLRQVLKDKNVRRKSNVNA